MISDFAICFEKLQKQDGEMSLKAKSTKDGNYIIMSGEQPKTAAMEQTIAAVIFLQT